MGFIPFLVTDSAIFWFLMLPLCLFSCSKKVLSIFFQKKIIKAEHDRKSHLKYGRPPNDGIHHQQQFTEIDGKKVRKKWPWLRQPMKKGDCWPPQAGHPKGELLFTGYIL
jgi:hypothetical protein